MNRDNRSIEKTVPTAGTLRDGDMTMDSARVSVVWCSGGVSMFTGEPRTKGYKLYITPCHFERKDGHSIMQSILMSGTRVSGLSYSIESAERYNGKRLKELAEAINYQQVANWYEENNDSAIVAHLSEVRHAISGQRLVELAGV